MSFGYIYKTTNLRNGNIYVGQHVGEFDPTYLGSGNVIKKAVKKYGRPSFSVIVLCIAETKSDLDNLEIFHISNQKEKLGSAKVYNILDGGHGPTINGRGFFYGRRHSVETRKKFSKNRTGNKHPLFGKGHLFLGPLNPHYGHKHSEETKKRISLGISLKKGPDHGNFGKRLSPEHIANMSRGLKGKAGRKPGFRCLDETKRKISAAKKGRKLPPFSDEHIKNMGIAQKARLERERVAISN